MAEFDTEDDAFMAAIKGARGGRTGGSTGVGPGGGFGGAFGGGGSGFLGGGGQGFGGDMMQPKRKLMAQGANGSIPLSYTPTKDTVPAMLSPGEYVMNNRTMQLPGANNLMSALNAMGNGGYSEGGMVLDPEVLVKILSMLAQFAGGEDDGAESEGEDAGGKCPTCGQEHGQGGMPGMACGGKVQRFAWGGQVQGQQGGFQRQGMGAPRMPSMGLGGQRMGGQSRPRPGGSYGQPRGPQPPMPTPPAQPMQPGTGGTTPQMGNPTFGPGFGGSGDTTGANGFQQSLYDLLNQYGATGMFSPEGDPRMMAAVQANATSNADAMRARQQNQMALGGMDAGQAGSYAMQQQLRGQGDIANALNQAQIGQLQAQQQFGRDLFGQVSGFNTDAWKAWNDYVHQQRLGG